MAGKPALKRPIVSRANMERAVKALHEADVPFRGFRLHPDGSVDVLAGEPLTTPKDEPPIPASDWDTALGVK